jgi:hypothetical protein
MSLRAQQAPVGKFYESGGGFVGVDVAWDLLPVTAKTRPVDSIKPRIITTLRKSEPDFFIKIVSGSCIPHSSGIFPPSGIMF